MSYGRTFGSGAYAAGGRPLEARIAITASPNIAAGGEATTLAGTGAGFTAPSGKSNSDWANGRRWDDENGLDTISLANQWTVVAWSLVARSGAAATGDQYEFRLLANGSPLDTYSVTPQLTLASASASSSPFTRRSGNLAALLHY